MHRDPDFSVGGFSLWVTDRAFPDADEPRGQDLLGFEALIETPNSTVRAIGMLSAAGLSRFSRDLTRQHEMLGGEAVLEARDSETTLILRTAVSRLGQVDATVDLRLGPDGDERHSFTWSLDQTDLQPLARNVRELSAAYPSPFPAKPAEPSAAVAPQSPGPTSWILNAIFGKR
jgi:hypothetical protein